MRKRKTKTPFQHKAIYELGLKPMGFENKPQKGSRRLDVRVARWFGWKKMKGFWVNPEGDLVEDIPAFTQSVDAALTLMTNGWRVILDSDADTKFSDMRYGCVIEKDSACLHNTLPLAICVAAINHIELQNYKQITG